MTRSSRADQSTACPLKSTSLSQKFLANYASLDEVRQFVGQVAQQCGYTEKAIYQIQLATDEAFTNIVEHAYEGRDDGIVECICQVRDQGLAVILHDCGKAFDPTAVPEPDLSAPLEDREIGGLGIYLMRKLMDEVHFTPAPLGEQGCNTLTMFKRKESSA